MSAPVLFLAFANDAGAHLPMLKAESAKIFSVLRDLDRQDFVRVHREESVDAAALFDTLVSFENRVAIFHYGGHADGRTLRLEGGPGHADGIAGLLAEQVDLKLVFLNGCATRPQVNRLLSAGVRAVIATSVSVRDDRAAEFAVSFYKALAARRTIGQAFALAQALLASRYGNADDIGIKVLRDLIPIEEEPAEPSPWGLFVREQHKAEVLDWKLPYYRPLGLSQDAIQDIGRRFTTNRDVVLVLDEMARYNPDINAQMVEQRGGQAVRRDSREYPEIIIRNFPWPIGSQIRLVRYHESPDIGRLEHLVSAYVRTAQLLYYILLSDLWEHRRRGTIELSGPLVDAVPADARAFRSFDFLTRTHELYGIFCDRGVTPYVVEYERVAEAWGNPASPLRGAHAALERIRSGLDASPPTTDVVQLCVTAEHALANVLRAAAFLARYRMLTVRNIAVEAPRFEAVSYELDMGPLNAPDTSGLWLYQDAAYRRKASFSNSHSIVLVRDENALDDCLNLSPFVIDKNTFVGTRKDGGAPGDRLAHIFMLSYEDGGRLVYLALDHDIRFALEHERDRIHTDMTGEDFAEGRNVGIAVAGSLASEPGSWGGDGTGVKVFRLLRDQLDAFLADIGTAS